MTFRSFLGDLLAWIAIAAAPLFVMLLLTSVLPVTPPANETEAALSYVCETLGHPCPGLAPPTLVEVDTESVFGRRTNGVFAPGVPGAVFIDLRVQGAERAQTVIHEVVHYVDWRYKLTMGKYEACVSEALAFAVANQWARENGGEPFDDWHAHYGCPDINVHLGG